MRKRNSLWSYEEKPKQVIEVEEKHVKVRFILMIVCIVVAMIAIGIWLYGLLTVEPGWYSISANVSENHCGNEFSFAYEVGASGMDGKTEKAAVTTIYSKACKEAYDLFTWDVEDPVQTGIRYVSDHPNQVVAVDPRLYKALALAKDSRLLYMGAVNAEYAKLFLIPDEQLAALYDPAQNPEKMAFITELMGYVGSDSHIRLELLEDNKVCLYVSSAYLNYALANNITAFLDFGWMKNAFIIDMLAEELNAKGYTRGYISSYDGFERYLAAEDVQYSRPVYDRFEDGINRPGLYSVKGGGSRVFFRNYPLLDEDEWHYYSFPSTGTIASVYVDPRDGVCKSATDNLVFYSTSASCTELVLTCAPLFLTEELDEAALLDLAAEGICAIWAEGKELRYTGKALALAVLEDAEYTVKYIE